MNQTGGQWVALDYEKIPLEIHASSRTEQFSRQQSCRREPQTVEWIESFADHSLFLDIGANVGCYSLVAAAQNRRGRTGIRVVAMEPAHVNFGSLLANVRHNGFDEQIVAVNVAAAPHSGLGLLHYDGRNGAYPVDEAGSSGHQFNRQIDHQDLPFAPILSQATVGLSIDDFSAVFGIEPNYLKIDVDGLESAILAGAARTLKSPALRSILIELREGSAAEVKDLLDGCGFSCSAHERHGNHLFSRP